MARPSKLTPEREQRLLAAIRAGSTYRAAAAAAGISEDTLARWVKRSAANAEALTRAEGESEVALVAIIRAAAPHDWRAAAHLLERRWPDSWGRREKLDVNIRQEAQRLADQLGLDVDELIAEANRIVKGHA